MLDPVLSQLLASVPLEVSLPIDWPAQRATAATLLPLIRGDGPTTEVASVEERLVDGPNGPVELRVYRPTRPTATTLHYIHGGGWAVGDLETVDHTIRHICEALPAVVVSSTYRLAPEQPFPAAYEDTLAAVSWTVDHLAELGGDFARLGIAGDSAGGNLAAAVAIGLRPVTDDGVHPLAAQLLLYPSVDLRDSSWTAKSRIADADPSLRCDVMRATAAAYIGTSDPDDWRLSPSAADDHSGLPPALIVVTTVDPLRDEAVAYGERLRQSGVHTEVMEFANMTHGFTHLRRIVPAAAEASEQVIDEFRKLLDRPK